MVTDSHEQGINPEFICLTREINYPGKVELARLILVRGLLLATVER
ncbi:hypothetical protein Shyhy01_04420 [Streptomyces hygroscopicus subsp. hygroscopicus]|nr:hypothetical protein Shyhy01_04420 [Streptomyces hygroscopicus subsp. hygroscopicus]